MKKKNLYGLILLLAVIVSMFCACTEPDTKVSITLYGNNGRGPEVYRGDPGTTLTLPTPNRDGYSFICWYDSNGNKYTAGNSFSFPSSDISLYARWNIKITYHGRMGYPDSTTVQSGTGERIELRKLSTIGFLGWYGPDGTKWEDGMACPNEHITLCAKWADESMNTLSDVEISWKNVSDGMSEVYFKMPNIGSHPELVVYYTIDGSDPSYDSLSCKLDEPFLVETTTTIKAFAHATGIHADSNLKEFKAAKYVTPTITEHSAGENGIYVKVRYPNNANNVYISFDGSDPTYNSERLRFSYSSGYDDYYAIASIPNGCTVVKVRAVSNEPRETLSSDVAISYDVSHDESVCHNCELGFVGPAGGYVFYDCDADNDSGNQDGCISSECGWRYLEAAPTDIVVESTGVFVFGYYRTYSSGSNLFVNGTTTYNALNCTGTAIGTGKTNTEKLVSAMGDSVYSEETGSSKTSNYAAI